MKVIYLNAYRQQTVKYHNFVRNSSTQLKAPETPKHEYDQIFKTYIFENKSKCM